MNGKWSRILLPLLILFATLMVSHVAFAKPHLGPIVAAPEFDLKLAIEGVAVAGGAAALLWERMRRRRK
jgi:membrane protein implicated in regulation of membrane protease activity